MPGNSFGGVLKGVHGFGASHEHGRDREIFATAYLSEGAVRDNIGSILSKMGPKNCSKSPGVFEGDGASRCLVFR